MRLQKFLARAGVASRRGSEDLMTAGRVAVNDEVVMGLGAKVDPSQDVVTVDGRVVALADQRVYVALNKPAGYVTTMHDPHGRATVAELVPVEEHPGLFPVGRLDQDTTGLLLFTTDGELAHRLLHPRWKVPKTYEATVEGMPGERTLDRLRTGVGLDDGITAPAKVNMVLPTDGGAVVRITITEGRKRQVKRMFSALSHPVVALHRTSFGPVSLGKQEAGTCRSLGPEEIAALRRAVSMEDE